MYYVYCYKVLFLSSIVSNLNRPIDRGGRRKGRIPPGPETRGTLINYLIRKFFFADLQILGDGNQNTK